jgi:hypothetical protein
MNMIAILLITLFSTRAETPLACNMRALNAAERKHHAELSRKVLSAVLERSDTKDGYAFQLDRKRITLAEVSEWIALEERCCPFFDFHLDLARENGPLTLTLGGREGVRQFIAAEFGFRS